MCSYLFCNHRDQHHQQTLIEIIDLFIGEHPRTTAVHTMARVQVTSGLTVTHVQMEPPVSTTALAGPGEGITALTRKTLVSPALPMRKLMEVCIQQQSRMALCKLGCYITILSLLLTSSYDNWSWGATQIPWYVKQPCLTVIWLKWLHTNNRIHYGLKRLTYSCKIQSHIFNSCISGMYSMDSKPVYTYTLAHTHAWFNGILRANLCKS